jgi:hypothetical protein
MKIEGRHLFFRLKDIQAEISIDVKISFDIIAFALRESRSLDS